MSYLLWVTNIQNSLIAINTKTIGFSKKHKNILSQVHSGDKGFFYIKTGKDNDGKTEIKIKKPLIFGEFEIASEKFTDDKKIFFTDSNKENYPIRFQIKTVEIFKQNIFFKPMVENLNFIDNKKSWGVRLMGRGVVIIPENDYFTIKERIN
jgi:predicted RNA-binding protein